MAQLIEVVENGQKVKVNPNNIFVVRPRRTGGSQIVSTTQGITVEVSNTPDEVAKLVEEAHAFG